MGSRLLLPDSGIYIAFIKNAVVKGDEVEYTTNFGVKLVSSGNSRTLGSFLGFRRANPDGTGRELEGQRQGRVLYEEGNQDWGEGEECE